MDRDEVARVVARELYLRALSAVESGTIAAQLALGAHERVLDAGEALYRAGERSEHIYIVVRGTVELRFAEGDRLRMDAPAAVGTIDVLRARPYAWTAVALTEVQALALRGEDLFEAVEEDFDYALQIIRRNAGGGFATRLMLAPHAGFPDVQEEAGPPALPLLNLVERVIVLRALSCFDGCAVEPIAILANGSDEIVLAPGEPLFQEGEPARSFFAVAGGVVRVERKEPAIRARFGRGSIVGGATALGVAHHPYTAVADTEALLLGVRHELFFDVLEDHTDMIRTVLAGLAAESEALLRARAAKRRAHLDPRTSQSP